MCVRVVCELLESLLDSLILHFQNFESPVAPFAAVGVSAIAVALIFVEHGDGGG